MHMLVQRYLPGINPSPPSAHHDVGSFGIVIAVELGELGECLLSLGAAALRRRADPVISLGAWSMGSGAHLGAEGSGGGAEGRLYDLGRALSR